MAELRFESPVVKWTVVQSAVTVADESVSAKVLVRAESASPAATHLAVAFGASRREGDTLIAATRPDEWLLLGPLDQAGAIADAIPRDGHVGVVDWTHGRAMFRVTGDWAASALEKVCSLDFSDPMTPDGAVTSASVAKVACDLIRDDQSNPSYLILCDRSFGQYLYDALIDAAAEFTG